MSDVTRILLAIDQGDPKAAQQLLPLVYDELRKLAAGKLAREKPGQTLQATALVHEAYLRLVGSSGDRSQGSEVREGDGDRTMTPEFRSRGHFFAVAAEAMRRILIEQARRKHRIKRGGDRQRLDLDQVSLPARQTNDDVLAIHEALAGLEAEDPQAADLVKLRFFVGLSLTEAAEVLGISRTRAYEQWSYARAWLRCALDGEGPALVD